LDLALAEAASARLEKQLAVEPSSLVVLAYVEPLLVAEVVYSAVAVAA